MLLDDIADAGALARDEHRFLACPQPKVFAAIQQVCPREIAGFDTVGRATPFDADRPLYAQMLRAGYSVLGTVPLREVVIGRVGPLPRPFAPEPRVRDRRAFAEYRAPGEVKVCLGFALQAGSRHGAPGTEVVAAFRMWPADGRSGWLGIAAPAIRPVAGAVSARFLRALAARAEA